jgi:hypothetical protein
MITNQSAVENSTDRGSISKMLMQLFEHWAISTEDQLEMLGLSKDNRAALARYRKGASMSTSRDAIERAGHLLAIHKNLRLLFPHNRDLAYKWMSTRNNAFEGRTPVYVIRDFGFAGLLMVRSYLDRMRGQ